MSTGFVGAGLSVQVAFNDTVWATSPVWTDITRFCQSITVTAGRQHELQQVNPSTAAITLFNGPLSHGDTTGGRFSPWNTGSAYYNSGNGLTPGHPVRIRQTISSTTYHVFYGYTQSWVPKYGQSMSQVVLNCYDGMALLNLAMMDQNLYEAQVLADGAVAYWECQDPVYSTTFADATGNGNTGTLFGSGAFGQTGALIAASDSAIQFSGGAMTTSVTASGTPSVMFEGWFNASNFEVLMSWNVLETTGVVNTVYLGTDFTTGEAKLVAQRNLTTGGGIVDATLVTGPSVTDGAFHHFAVQVPVTDTTGTYTLWVDGNLVGSGANSSYLWRSHSGSTALGFMCGGYYYPIGSTVYTNGVYTGAMDQVAYYATPLTTAELDVHISYAQAGFLVQDSGARTQVVLEAFGGVPTGLINCDTGAVAVQGSTTSLAQTTIASYLQQVTNTERGILYQDTTGVLQFKNRYHVYNNAASTTSQMTFTYVVGSGEQFISTDFVPQEDDTDLFNDWPVGRQGGTIQRASDQTSIDTYGRRTGQGYTSLLFVTDEDSYDLAQFLLYQYKDPQPRVRSISTSYPINNGAALPLILGLNLLDRISIVWKPVDGSSVNFSQQSLVEQVTHTISAGQWDTTLAVTPIGTENFANYGTDHYGTGIYGP